ncbi:MAG: hypothetical protein WEA36_03630 [Balneolaceae bacterium]
MNMNRLVLQALILMFLVSACQTESDSSSRDMTDVEERDRTVPGFDVDPYWPDPLPENWMVGQVAGVAVDQQDRIWIAHRPSSLTLHEASASTTPPVSLCCQSAPSVMAFSPDGELLHAWSTPQNFEFADDLGFKGGSFPHGIHVDHNGYVWVGGGIHQHQVLKFTEQGEHLLTIGDPAVRGDSNSEQHLGGPASMLVDPETNELYIADGYRNRRVVVFDAETGAYRRHWGAYGERPNDDPLGYDFIGPDRTDPERQFRGAVHGLALSDDGHLYVTDRENSRIQIFERDGIFVDELFIHPETRSSGSTWDLEPDSPGYEQKLADLVPGSTWDVALSEDPDQRWLYVADGTNNRIWIVNRMTLRVEGHFGRGGKQAGQFGWLHNLAVDSNGNLYTGEVAQEKRAQKFVKQ